MSNRYAHWTSRSYFYFAIFFIYLRFSAICYAAAITERSDDQLVIINLSLGRTPLYTSIMAYQDGSSLWIPLTEYITAMDFPIAVQIDDQYAKGWFINEKNNFLLDLNNHSVTIKGEKHPLTSGVERHQNDFYVRIDLLDTWFPLKHTYDPSRLLITLTTTQEMPLDAARLRELRRQKLKKKTEKTQNWQYQTLPYRWLNWPFIDLNIAATHNQTTETTQNWRGSLAASGDILLGTGHLNLAAAEDQSSEQRNANIYWTRRFFKHKTTPLNIEIGDLFSPNFNGLAEAAPGLGISASNIPASVSTRFSELTLDGKGTPGWDAELYQNNQLIAAQQIGIDSHYHFNDVPLNFGYNDYSVKLYGPQGQVRERIVRRIAEQSWFKPGHWLYRVHWQKDNQDLLLNDNENASEFNNRAYGLIQYGLSDKTVWRAQWLRENNSQYFSTSLHQSLAGGIASLNPTLDRDGGKYLNTSWEGRIGNHTSAFKWERMSEFTLANHIDTEQVTTSNDNALNELPTSKQTGNEYSLRFNGTLAQWNRKTLSHQWQYTQRNNNNDTSKTVNQRLSYNTAKMSFTHQTRWQDTTKDTFDGSLLVRYGWRRFALSNTITYRQKSGTHLEYAALNMSYRTSRKWSILSRSNWRFDDDNGKSNDHQINISLLQKKARWSLSLQRKDHNWNIGLELSTAALRSPLSGNWQRQANQTSEQGAVAFRAFMDNNNNEKYDPDETLLEHVGVSINNRQVRSDDMGQGLAINVAPDSWSYLNVREKDLDDPYWLATRKPLKFLSRPGSVLTLDIPIVESGEIDGTCWTMKKDKKLPVGHVLVQLFDHKKELIREVFSSYDGFYLFDRLVPGQYTVSLEPKQLQQLELANNTLTMEATKITLKGNGDIHSGVDFIIKN